MSRAGTRDKKQSEYKRSRKRLRELSEKRNNLLRQLLLVEKAIGVSVRRHDRLAEYMGHKL